MIVRALARRRHRRCLARIARIEAENRRLDLEIIRLRVDCSGLELIRLKLDLERITLRRALQLAEATAYRPKEDAWKQQPYPPSPRTIRVPTSPSLPCSKASA